MISHLLRTAFLSLGAGFVLRMTQDWVGSSYFADFLRGNLINLLIALLAVNSATMGIVLTKIRELIEEHGHGDAFKRTRDHFLLSVKEQVGLIAVAILFLTLSESTYLKSVQHLPQLFGAVVHGIFVYSMLILYDIAKSVLIIIDFNPRSEE